MSRTIINNIQENLIDFSYGIKLPVISLSSKKYLVGLQYKNNEINFRNLYQYGQKKQTIQKVGVIKYLTPKLNIMNIKDYEVYLKMD